MSLNASYTPKQFNLSGLTGISNKTLEMHFKLYAWSDWGTPDRVVQSLCAAGLQPPWMARLGGAAPAAAS